MNIGFLVSFKCSCLSCGGKFHCVKGSSLITDGVLICMVYVKHYSHVVVLYLVFVSGVVELVSQMLS